MTILIWSNNTQSHTPLLMAMARVAEASFRNGLPQATPQKGRENKDDNLHFDSFCTVPGPSNELLRCNCLQQLQAGGGIGLSN